MDKEKRGQFAQALKDIDWDSPQDRFSAAAVIVTYLQDVIEQKEVASLFLTKKTLQIGEQYEFIHRKRLRAYWHEPGSYAPRTAMTQVSFTVPMDMLSCHPEYEIQQLKAGRYGTVEEQTAAAEEAMLGALNAYTFALVRDSVPSTSSFGNYFTIATAVNKATLDSAVRYVENTVGSVAAIVGLKKELDPIRDFNTVSNAWTGVYSDQTVETIRTKGLLDIYSGAPVVPLYQWVDGFGAKTIPEKEIIVVGKDAGVFVTWEEMQNMEGIDIDNLTWHIHIWTKAGAAVFFPERIARIKIT